MLGRARVLRLSALASLDEDKLLLSMAGAFAQMAARE
jgi:hypothetical protein